MTFLRAPQTYQHHQVLDAQKHSVPFMSTLEGVELLLTEALMLQQPTRRAHRKGGQHKAESVHATHGKCSQSGVVRPVQLNVLQRFQILNKVEKYVPLITSSPWKKRKEQ